MVIPTIECINSGLSHCICSETLKNPSDSEVVGKNTLHCSTCSCFPHIVNLFQGITVDPSMPSELRTLKRLINELTSTYEKHVEISGRGISSEKEEDDKVHILHMGNPICIVKPPADRILRNLFEYNSAPSHKKCHKCYI